LIMDEHASIQALLTLAAAGALDAGEQHRVEQHLRDCVECREEFQGWSRLTGALEALPTPQAPLGLVERTRRQLENRAAVRAERRQSRTLLVWVNVLAWASLLLTWPLFQLLGGRLAGVLEISSRSITQVWIGYIVVSWMMSVVVAGLLGQRRREERTL
jgi:anti-sigma factor RsiW